jgi:3-hydroxyacyl-CoA dehydrogenase/enoyl-CoA hydratase/3-hydroxybutyryl-CoA epimerase/enoyl-CoA isomerase
MVRGARRHGPADQAALDAARKQLARSAALYPAPLAAAELMAGSAGLGRDAALALENQAFGRIGRTQAATSMVQQFVNDQFIKGKGKAYAKIARPLRQAGVLGAGIMGGGSPIRQPRGVPVVMKDIAQQALDLGVGEARKRSASRWKAGACSRPRPRRCWPRSARRSITTARRRGCRGRGRGREARVRSRCSRTWSGGCGPTRSSPEHLLAPHREIAGPAAAGELRRHAFLQSGAGDAAGRGHPRRETSDVAAATVAGLCGDDGQTPIVVQDCPGFLVNRILTAYLLGHLRALHDGADYLVVDTVMEKFGWPMGPAYLQDVIGMDTMKHVVEIIAAGYQNRYVLDFPLATMLLADRNRLGQKNGVGFYRYETYPKGKPKKLVDAQTAQLLATLQPQGRREFGEAEIIERLMLPMMVEAAICLEQGVAASAAEIDTALVLGLGFPRYAGGPLKYSDWLGLAQVVRRCDAYAAASPLYRATARMRAMARPASATSRPRLPAREQPTASAVASPPPRQRRDAAAELARLERVHEAGDDAPAGRADRMAERAGAAVDVDARRVELELADRGHRHHRKGLVDFVQVDIACGPAESRQHLLHGADRRRREPLRLLRVAGVADDARQRLQAPRAGGGAAHQHCRRGAVGNRG